MEVPLFLVVGVPEDSGLDVKEVILCDQCVFCRRNGKASEFHFNSESSLLTTVNWVWGLLQRRSAGEDEEEREIFGVTQDLVLKEAKKFNNLPKICKFCGDKVLELDWLRNHVKREIDAFRDFIRERSSLVECQEEEGLEADDEHCQVDDGDGDRKEVLGWKASSSRDPLAMDDDHDDHSDFDNDNLADSVKEEYSEDSMIDDNECRMETDPLATSPLTINEVPSTSTSSFRFPRISRPSKNSNMSPEKTWSFTKKLVKGKEKLRFKCEICGNTYTCRSTLKKHIRKMHKVDPGIVKTSQESSILQSCEMCKIKLPRKELLNHVKGHVGQDYTIRCPNKECWFVCVTPFELYRHLLARKICLKKSGEDREEFKRKQRTCTICGFSGGTLQGLRGHLLQEHETPEKNYSCPISGCGVKFTLRESVVHHLGQHDLSKEMRTQPCLECDMKIKIGIEKMEAHLKEVHGIQHSVKCIQCSFRFSSREQLVDHLFQHRFGELLCDICGETGERFSRHVNLVEHYFTQHQIGKKYQCEYCPRLFWKRSSLGSHVATEHKNKDDTGGNAQIYKPTFNCKDCEMVFKSRSGLIQHRIKIHGDPPLTCKYSCSETFTDFLALKKHENVVHKGVAPPKEEFPCKEPNCGKVFKTKYQLRDHQKYTHLGEKGSHVCEICGKVFTNSTGLKTHVEAVHLGIRKWVCEICAEAFTSSSVLKKHKLIHTGERPFACDHDHCGQRFRTKEVLQRHLTSHQEKGADFKPNGPMKKVRARVQKRKAESLNIV